MAAELGDVSHDPPASVIATLAGWQREGVGVQLHPGDLGWNTSVDGAEGLIRQLRVWRRAGRTVAMALADEAVARMAMDPKCVADADLARGIADDFDSGRVPAASLEARFGGALPRELGSRGWTPGEAWTPLARDLGDPVPDGGLRVEIVGEPLAQVRTAVHRASFGSARFTAEKWRMMAAGPAYAAARCLVGYDADANPVAAATVWGAGPGRPGLLEPLGVDPAYRGNRHGTAIALAAAAALRELGASSATVATPSANTVGVATYESAGYRNLGDAHDLRRPER